MNHSHSHNHSHEDHGEKASSEIWLEEKKHELELDNKEQKDSIGFPEAANIAVSLQRWHSVSASRRKIPKSRRALQHRKAGAENSCSILAEHELPRGSKPLRRFGRDSTDFCGADDANRRLVHYFVKVSDCHGDLYSDNLDIDYIVDLLKRGADLNTRDRYQQTVLHEVARNWGPDVMELMVESGGDVNAADYQGWTPLHVAAACDYPEMCRTLQRLGANTEAQAANKQTPLFFAAKTDSAKSLRALIKLGCDIHARDNRGRTPLFAACELDRSATAAVLLKHKADAFVQDVTGQIAFVPLIEKMPPLAKDALQPLHVTYRIERKQRLNLFKLDPRPVSKPGIDSGVQLNADTVVSVPYHSAMEAIISTNNYQVIILPIITEMISVQWTSYGRFRTLGQVVLQLLNIIFWTVFAVGKEWTQRYVYEFPQDGYRIAVLASGCVITIYLIIDEIMEYLRARRRHTAWREWRLKLIEQDLTYAHTRHTEESDYLRKEMAEVRKTSISYFNDWWNYLDWSCYIILLASVVSHFVDVGWPGGDGNLIVARWHVRIMALNIFVLWIRLLKYVKPFEFFGPFIVMLGMMLTDLFKFLLLYLEFFIPFACIFWTILGGTNNMKEADLANSGTLKNYTAFNFTRVSVDHLDTVSNTLITLFRLTLVDSYDYKNMVAIDTITAQVMLGAWFAISAILFLNLFVAQLSETFKSVYDNAKAAATMQKAITMQSCYETMSMSRQVEYHRMLANSCNPLEIDYDDDVTKNNPAEEQQRATTEIRSMANELQAKLGRLCAQEIMHSDSDESDLAEDTDAPDGRKSRKKKTRTRHEAEKASTNVRSRLERLESEVCAELKDIRQLLHDVAIVVAGITSEAPPAQTGDGGSCPESHAGATQDESPPRRQQVVPLAGITEVEPMAPQFFRGNT